MKAVRRKPRVSNLLCVEHLEIRTVLTAPTISSPAAVSVPENQAAVETVTATDTTVPAPTLTYSVSGGADAALFSINPSTGALVFLSAPDFEHPTDAGADNIYNLNVTVNDGNSGTNTQNLVVTVTPVNDNAPVFTSPASYNLVQKTLPVGTVTATDADLPAQTITYSITGGPDAALFSINATTGKLAFLTAPDFANPTDVGKDNVYNLNVTADDGQGMTTVQATAVMVTETAPVTPPVITLNPVAGTYYLNKKHALVSPTATFVSDSSVKSFAGSKLDVSITANADSSDVLSIYQYRHHSGKVYTRGNRVMFDGKMIGRESGGTGTNSEFSVKFTSKATEAAINQLVKQINFFADSASSVGSARTVQMQLVDLNGTVSNQATRTINVSAHP
ncbi:MAG: Cadherin domain protein [Planctomycetaceae bacterium]|nr:Cadherin domain protein [Planctomycetaceae bacterium]